MEAQKEKEHKLVLDRREKATVTGVKDVISFDEKEILLQTEFGKMTVKGEGLHVKRLTLEKGEAELEGQVNGILYSAVGSVEEEGGFLNRLFR
ncbi:sporulation protein YabP [Cuneatibacter sp. NSJ-177]|uniref:sporulation protein YabP n=1 Tax=Cuneatibacter sp. NSJ-177 TaxID=2931401 RepID=UPI001FD2BE51|nr:sporulation protein YabP [Cuneatibacter sp. NSJ-177]MCJ7836634.1 sporulation protein YabP [Cuneatibacter sp. NSJ-177]